MTTGIDTPAILPLLQAPTKLVLSGSFGAGKTTLALERIRWLLRQERVRGDDILVLVPQRSLAEPYHAALRTPGNPPGPPVRVTTFASLVKNAVELYWPLVAEAAGFQEAAREPTFLTLETAQYHMAPPVDEALANDEFAAVRVERSRVISQVLDNLNKAALQGLEISAAYERLELAVPAGEQRTGRLNALRAARRISEAFRRHCLEHTLLDFSLQVVLFNEHILRNDWSRTHLFRSHRHLVYDNVEEDTLSAHRLVRGWLPHLESALLIVDDDAGFRGFLGADPEGALELAAVCDEQMRVTGSFVMAPPLVDLARQVQAILGGRAGAGSDPETRMAPIEPTAPTAPTAQPTETGHALVIPGDTFRFYPQMIAWAAGEIRRLVVDEGIPPGEIAVLAPFVSDALRFSLQTALARHGIALATHRPSRALETEPAARTLLTLAKLAHPHWGLRPPPEDVTLTLTTAVPDLDPVRARLMSEIVYPPRRRDIDLGRFGALREEMRQRVTYAAGERYDRLQDWLYAYRSATDLIPLDQFLARLFGELLSQPGFGFHDDLDAARVASQLVESARKFRWALESQSAGGVEDLTRLGRSYIQLAEDGAIGALYLPGWRMPEDAVFLAPAYTFLLRNRAVEVQVWLDVGAGGWWERLYQPLTHPFVLSPRWPEGALWTDRDEYLTRQETMRRLLLGLIRRARRQIFLGISDYSESGYEQRGPLLSVVNRLLAINNCQLTIDNC